jgi:sarcosine oxidase
LREEETAPMSACARHTDCSNVTVASGFSGHVFKFAIDGVTDHPISLFDPKRLVTT